MKHLDEATLERIIEQITRRIHEITEMQRLGEERFRQEEADAATRLARQQAPRPLTHDLVDSLLGALGAGVAQRHHVVSLRDEVELRRGALAGELAVHDYMSDDSCPALSF